SVLEPEKPSERTTEQFEKLKESNRKLFEANRLLQEELTRKARSEQTFAPIQQPQVPLAPAPSMEQFTVVDPVSGERYVDEKKLASALADATQRATRAETAVQSYIRRQDVLDEEKQTREAYASHPEINPSSEKFDAEVSRRTRALLLDSMMNPQDYGGTQLSFKDAADEAKKQTSGQAKVLEEKTQQVIESKEQATASATGVSGETAQQISGSREGELDQLRYQTRFGRGDDPVWAVAKRLTKVPHTGTPTSSET
ncbi:MAG TPA: hypothetical protein DCS09_00260, partial [Porphyromonadaceae bacterium]|nr:hypothetical protein [Porphyromonadaceae bacterium]